MSFLRRFLPIPAAATIPSGIRVYAVGDESCSSFSCRALRRIALGAQR
jgi:hypothetical protein